MLAERYDLDGADPGFYIALHEMSHPNSNAKLILTLHQFYAFMHVHLARSWTW